MSYYCGIDLHSTNHVVCLSDDEDKRLLESYPMTVAHRSSPCFLNTKVS